MDSSQDISSFLICIEMSDIFLSALLLCKSDGLERTTFHLVFVTAAARRRAAVAVFIVFSRLKSFFFYSQRTSEELCRKMSLHSSTTATSTYTH